MGKDLIFKERSDYGRFDRVLRPEDYESEFPSYAIMTLESHKDVFFNEWSKGELQDQGDEYMIFYNQEGRGKAKSRPVIDPEERRLVISIAWPMVLE